MDPIRVTAAVLVREGTILLARRSATRARPLLWEFPGGKVEAGENDQACLRRELHEELSITADIGVQIGVYSHSYPDVKIELAVYFAVIKYGEPLPYEHQEISWVYPENLLSYDLAPADIPAAELLSSGLGRFGYN